MAVGRIGKPHGVRGWVTVASTTDEPERRFAPGATVFVEDTPTVVLDSRLGGRTTVLLEGCADRQDAETLRGRWLYVDADDQSPEDPDEFYDHQLEGLTVYVDGVEVGRVIEVLHLPGQDILTVGTSAGRVLVPFVAAIVTDVDLAAARVDVVAVEGLFDDAH